MTKTKNALLSAAKKAKNDEFYTQWTDIEREMNSYLEYDPDVFRGKTILLPCDDPEWSNFTKFFALHFRDYGLKKLISTSYAPKSNADGAFYTPTPLEKHSPKYDESKSMQRGRVFVLEANDVNNDGVINIDDLQWSYLEGDGDFRSEEVIALRDEADIVVTNPPFSLFREFVAWLIEGGVKFSVIGSNNAVTYKEIFPLFQQNTLWFGPTITSGDREFRVPERYPLNAAGFRVDKDGTKYIRVKGVRWYTNIDHGRRHEPLQLMTIADNIKFSKHKEIRGVGYQRYTNYDAIEVPFTDAIPSDYEGAMGVPITFLDKYNPDQFEILGSSKWVGLPISDFAEKGTYEQGGMRFYLPNGDGTHRRLYDRIVIIRKAVA
ncbi:adenine-specific methyltransferase EcoRI family protein [Azonexus fungiphilus]|uniref:adenine-specific methyltransferase EcoRI family protein n=1 Tax=Azonexus fungiphilus TaxID=146940 RepID=UPI00156ADE1F|nr:adenine-specific methyltransferase EcoRI family protein [Azonexus fungiphilus]NHC06392.1 DNA methyltransferase [Azonexus fungiphilus]